MFEIEKDYYLRTFIKKKTTKFNYLIKEGILYQKNSFKLSIHNSFFFRNLIKKEAPQKYVL